MGPYRHLATLWTAGRRLTAAGILPLWIGSHLVGCGWGWHGLHWVAPRSAHWPVTLGVTGVAAGALALLLWPTPRTVRRLVWTVLVLLLVGEVWLGRNPPEPPAEVVLLPDESGFTARLHQPHHYTLFQPRPDLRTPDGLVHNRLGFRDARPLLPDPTAIRLVFMGGPTVYGAVTRDNREMFPASLEQRLNDTHRAELDGRHFEVINAGMVNATSAETLLRLIFAVSEVRPAVVAIQLGISDAWPRVASDDQFGDFRQMRKLYGHGRVCQPRLSMADSLARALIHRSVLLDRWLGPAIPGEPLLEMTNHTNTGKVGRLARNPPIHFERNLRYALAVVRAMGAQPLLIGDPVPAGLPDGIYRRAVPEHNAVMARLARAEGVPYLDLEEALPLTDDIRLMDKYLNADGERRKAGVLYRFLRDQGVIDGLLARTTTSAP